ncbi:hypothetical protein GLOTRDRAFT_75877 [Gloeophyllum trabeum ATCC 11539]|uniref:Uncharacterized protein n=1 Tax=Gloeophyllum trabeum (strain ATCC 11539 / FP-39264 / Madison 617) TaxID=670483 RepID=S7Q867_GLOTA|nr:uncharacterized protein GLOTRDRAFT_75877 [Gloeophyllum trabeum ATCC 11539]EPQ55722.1 hypothetical protein GLOTRDRAFT_75877 [Gloeophyllum trabeum ATCC 11539]
MVVITDDKSMHRNLPPPPPYYAAGPVSPPPFPNHFPRPKLTLATLPSHILLQIVYATFPRTADKDEGKLERQRKTLYWLSTSLRLVNRAFYIACMHVLRSTYLPAYESLIRPPYSSDPFPYTAASTSSSSSPAQTPVNATQRETAVLDQFIALKVREDVWADESELHIEREDSFKDLFDLMQPRSRLEDLVRHYGVRDGVVSADGEKGKEKGRAVQPLPFVALSVSFSTRKAGLVLNARGGKRTIVEVPRTRDEKLEVAAKRLVRELRIWLEGYSR